jgi:prepilin-type N-terminal cleavage/methylation domain-containing protein
VIKMKSFKIMGLGPRKSKSGFTLIELLIVMVIIAILAGVIVMAVGGVFTTARSTAYATAREQIQTAVGAYAAANSGALPLQTGAGNSTTIPGNGSIAVTVINMSALLTQNSPGGTLRAVPSGTYTNGAPPNAADNCNGSVAVGCTTTSHYTWYVDAGSSVYSLCTNSGGGATLCTLTNTSGYQGVWP